LGQTAFALPLNLLLRRHNKLAQLHADDNADFTPPMTENKRHLCWYGAAAALYRASGARHEAAETCTVGLVQAREAFATQMTRLVREMSGVMQKRLPMTHRH